MYGEFTKRDTVVIAVAQEDKDLKTHARFLDNFQGDPPFDIVADLKGRTLPKYDRTTSYLIDKQGVIREIFPSPIHMRPHWQTVLNRIDELKL